MGRWRYCTVGKSPCSLSVEGFMSRHDEELEAQQVKISVSTSADCSHALIDLVGAGRSSAAIKLSALELEGVLHQIAATRACLAEPVPDEVKEGSGVVAIYNPRWGLTVPSGEGVPPGILMLLRHPGLGWISFLVPPDESEALGRSLYEISQEFRLPHKVN
jgi:hypothetical protein